MINLKNIEDITLMDVKNKDLTMKQLLDIYTKFGFTFIGSNGEFKYFDKEF